MSSAYTGVCDNVRLGDFQSTLISKFLELQSRAQVLHFTVGLAWGNTAGFNHEKQQELSTMQVNNSNSWVGALSNTCLHKCEKANSEFRYRFGTGSGLFTSHFTSTRLAADPSLFHSESTESTTGTYCNSQLQLELPYHLYLPQERFKRHFIKFSFKEALKPSKLLTSPGMPST